MVIWLYLCLSMVGSRFILSAVLMLIALILLLIVILCFGIFPSTQFLYYATRFLQALCWGLLRKQQKGVIMLRVKGKLLSLEERAGTGKDGKPYYGCNFGVLDQDNEFHTVRVFDRDGSLKAKVTSCKIGQDVVFKCDKAERLANRTFDTMGQFE